MKVCITNNFSILIFEVENCISQSLVCFNISLVITQLSGLERAQQNGRPVLGFKFCQYSFEALARTHGLVCIRKPPPHISCFSLEAFPRYPFRSLTNSSQTARMW